MSGIKKAYISPGLPHLVFGNGAWSGLSTACKKASELARATKPDVIVIYSSQWISVLGHSFQANPNPKGLHVDENWYALGDFPFSFKVDVDLAKKSAEIASSKGLATKLVNYEGFPIDTGTLVSLKFFNPDNTIPVAIVSSNIYAGQKDSFELGQAVGKAIKDLGRKAVLINCSGLSQHFFTKDIDGKQDKVSSDADDKWNRKILDLIGKGKNKEAYEQGPEYAKEAACEMMFKGFYFMMGAMGMPDTPGKLLEYGPIWGTGAAVVEYELA